MTQSHVNTFISFYAHSLTVYSRFPSVCCWAVSCTRCRCHVVGMQVDCHVLRNPDGLGLCVLCAALCAPLTGWASVPAIVLPAACVHPLRPAWGLSSAPSSGLLSSRLHLLGLSCRLLWLLWSSHAIHTQRGSGGQLVTICAGAAAVVRSRLRSVRGRPQLHSRVARVPLGVLVVWKSWRVTLPSSRKDGSIFTSPKISRIIKSFLESTSSILCGYIIIN